MSRCGPFEVGPFEADHLERYQNHFLTLRDTRTLQSVLDGNPPSWKNLSLRVLRQSI